MPGEECRGLAQHRPPSSVVLHCRRQSDVWPNVSLPPSDTRWRARHRRRPRFPWGTKPRGTTKRFPWGTKPPGRKEYLHPLASAATLTPPQLPLGDETPGTTKKTETQRQRRASLGGRNPGERRIASLGGQNPGDNNNDNAQPSRVRSQKRNDKDDAQPPRLRQTKQASPLGRNF